MEAYLPLLTAVFSLANTVVLLVINRRTGKLHDRVNGLVMQQMLEAEERGRRLEAHKPRRRPAGE